MHTSVQSFIHFIEFEKRYSVHTIESYKNDLSQFTLFLQNEKGNAIKDAQHFEIRNWIVSMMQQKITSRSINRKISALKSYYKFLLRRGEIKKNPLSKVLSPKSSKRLPAFVELPGMDILLSQIEFAEGYEGLLEKMIIELLYGTGIRRSELMNLKETDFDAYNAQVKVLGKGNKERIIPVHPELRKAMLQFMADKKNMLEAQNKDYLLVDKNGRKLSAALVYKTVKKYLNLVTTVEKRSPHTLRHSFATHLMNNGADINAVKELLGHSSLAATQVYTHNTIDKLKNIHKQAHPRG